jgi:hypothetical protein
MVASAAVIDQNNVGFLNGVVNDTSEWQQQVTDGIGGQLSGVELYTASDVNDTFTVKIGIGSGFYTGPYAYTGTATVTHAGTIVDTSAAGIYLTPGEHFVIDISGGSPGPYCCNLSASSEAYPGGDLYYILRGVATDFTTLGAAESIAFTTYIDPVPLPAAVWLLFSGFAGLGALMRKGIATS